MKPFHCLAGLALAAGLAASAQAKVLIHHVHLGNFTFNTAEAAVPIEVNNNGTVYSHMFNINKAGTYLFNYSAECSVLAAAGVHNAWVDLDLMDGLLVLAPTVGNTDAFCSSNGTGAYGQWTRASITIPVFLIAGTHEIHIKARLNSGATGAWLGDSVTTLSQ